MNVILLQRVEKLGAMGAIVRVKDGFARNYLIPQGMALRANKSTLDAFEKRRADLEAADRDQREQAAGRSLEIEGHSVVVIRQASETKQLYGSVTARDIAEALGKDGVEIDRREVRIDTPIKTLGIFAVRLLLHPEVEANITVNVARSQEEADIQSGKAEPEAEEEALEKLDVAEDPSAISFDDL